MICSNCGKEISNNVKFCKYCGAEQNIQSNSRGKEREEYHVEPEKHSRKRAVIIILSVILFLGLAGAGVYFMMDRLSLENLYTYQDPDTGLWGYIDDSGKQVIKPQFKDALGFTEGAAPVCDVDTNLWGYIDEGGEYIVKPEYTEAYRFEESRALVCTSDGKWGYIDNSGNYAVEPEYSDAYKFTDGLAAVCDENGLWGYIDDSGEYFIEPQFGFTYGFYENYAAVQDKDSELWGFIDNDGNYIIKPQFADCDYFSEGYVSVLDVESGLWGYIDKTGGYVIEPQFKHAYPFVEGIAVVCEAGTESWYYVDKEGTYITENDFSAASSFSEGKAAACDGNGLWGYVDETGDWIIEPQFEKANAFSDGIAMVYNKNGVCDYIDESGESIIKGKTIEEKNHSLKARTVASYEGVLGPFYSSELDMAEYYCDINIKIPELDKSVQGYKTINREISRELFDYIYLVENLESGDYRTIENYYLALVRATYGIYEYNDTSAFVIEYCWLPYATGGDPSYMIYYYDNLKEEWIDYEEYASLNGYSLEDVFYEYEIETGNYRNVDVSALNDNGLIFFFNNDGILEFRESLF